MNTALQARIQTLREVLQERQLDALLISGSDPHQSEYVAERWKERQWFSGFTGSAGTLLVTHNHAGLWTDSRYFIQAEQELAGTGVQLHRQGVPYAPEHLGWLRDNLPPGSRVGVDFSVFSIAQVRHVRSVLPELQVIDASGIVDEAWSERPEAPKAHVFDFSTFYAGESRSEKLSRLRKTMTVGNVDVLLLSALDDIAWLFNLRGKDVDCNPVFYAYALVGNSDATLFLQPGKMPEALEALLRKEGVQVKAYEELHAVLTALPSNQRIGIDPQQLNAQIYQSLPSEACVEQPSPVQAMKACKNTTEVEHLRNAMRKDGVALLRLFRWLEATLPGRGVSEVEVAQKLDALRAEQAEYHGESFAAIVGYAGNGAIVHYHAEEGRCAELRPEGILLLDSGGQYTDGTTDITRTIALGPVTAHQKRHFTRVLQGHIDLAMAHFPQGTTGVQLDVLARMPLWMEGLNYGHGTGHGVGFFLNVHEGPQGITPAANPKGTTPLEPGMICSNEPGFYLPDEYGIRIENLVLVREVRQTDFGQFLDWETLTLFPIDASLIDASLLSQEQLRWLNDYHARVYAELAPLLNPEERNWLQLQTAKLEKV